MLVASSAIGLSQQIPAPPAPPKQSETEAPSFTFKAVTSIVVVDIVARDAQDNPVRDLSTSDLHVSEKIADGPEIPEKMASFELVTDTARQRSARTSGIVLGWLHPSFCPLTGAYELSYYLSAESRKDGLHRIFVTSIRPGVRLFFRPGYRIEAEKPAAVSPEEFAHKPDERELREQQRIEAEREKHPELDLARIACYDTLDLTNFALAVSKLKSALILNREDARKTGTKQKIPSRLDTYQFVVPGSYFAAMSAGEPSRSTQLDFSMCVFNSFGHPLRHFDGTVESGTSSPGHASLTSQGLAHSFTVEGPRCQMLNPLPKCDWPPSPAEIAPNGIIVIQLDYSARIVVRDRNTGALGSGELLLADLGRDPFSKPIPEGETNESFGTSTSATPLAMCGDVYQLAPWTVSLPLFSELDAIAPIYSTSFAVYSRFFTPGIPGITSRTEWFGVNYQGRFGIDKAGKYDFDLLSDDGAKVYIDDKLIVSDDTVHPAERSRGKVQLNAGAHTIRVSYFQGPRIEVALVLLVKPPGRGWRLFDTRDFPTPEEPAQQRKKLPEPENKSSTVEPN